jgi:hypothetical protein
MENMSRYRTWPLASDATPAMSPETMGELAALMEALGAGIDTEEPDPAAAALRHNLFRGSAVRGWAEAVRQIATAVVDPQKPLSWILYQAPVEVQQQLSGRGRLLAVNRFRYVETSIGSVGSGGAAVPRMNSTYMNEKLAILQGGADNRDLSLKFYLTSRDRNPSATLAFDRPWAIFELYLKGDFTSDAQGNIYIPLYFQEGTDRYVYYTVLEFNREIPGASSWYSLRNWPDLIGSGGVVTERRQRL